MELAARGVPARLWRLFLIRAAVALVIAAVITFSADHTPTFGLVVFGAFAIATGAVLLAAGLRSVRTTTGRGVLAVQGAAGILGGVVGLVAAAAGTSTAAVALVPVIAATALVTGALELALGLLSVERAGPHRDRVAVGGAGVLLALVVALVPSDPVFVVGMVGAYAAIVGVYLVIGGLSLRFDDPQHSRAGKVTRA